MLVIFLGGGGGVKIEEFSLTQGAQGQKLTLLSIKMYHFGLCVKITKCCYLACKAGVFWSVIHELFSGITLCRHLGR